MNKIIDNLSMPIKIKILTDNSSLLIFKNKTGISSFILKMLSKELKGKSNTNLLISGGTSLNVLLSLINSKINVLNKLNIFLTDERIVEVNSNLANQKKILKLFFKKKKINKPNFLSLISEINKLSGYDQTMNLSKLYPKPKNIPLSIFGVGSDGHVASLHVSIKLLYKDKNFIICKKKDENFDRISLTYDYLCRLPFLILIIEDTKKVKILKKIISLNRKSNLPIIKLMRAHQGKIFILTTKYYIRKI